MGAARRHLACAAVAFAAPFAAAAPASAQVSVAPPIRAVFLKEYAKPAFGMFQGQVLVFRNSDPFLSHGVAGAFFAPVIPPGSSALVRRAPFLGPGTYGFADPANPDMTSTLVVQSQGAPLPRDAKKPRAKLKLAGGGRGISRGRAVVRANPSEPADVKVLVKAGKRTLGTATKATPTGRARKVKVTFNRKRLRGRSAVKLKVTVTDVAGNKRKKTIRKRL